MGGGSQTSTQKTEYDPAYMAKVNQNYDRALNIADAPFQPYTGQRVATFSPTQQQGQAGLLSAANDPTATNTLNGAKGILGNAVGANNGILNFQPRTVTANPITASTYDPAQLADVDLSKYMNPFQKQVIDASVAQNQYARDQQGVADNAAATAAHAFGGSRQGVQRAETTAAYDRNNQQNIAALNSANFGQAQQAALADVASRNQGGIFNAGQRQNAGIFNAGQDFNAQQTNASNDIAGAGLRLNASGQAGNLSSLLASMSDQELHQALTRAGIIEGVGAEQTGQQQAQNDAAYEEFMRQLQYPYQTQNLTNAALGAYPVQATTTNTTKTKGDVLGGILGAIAGGAKVGSQFYGGGG